MHVMCCISLGVIMVTSFVKGDRCTNDQFACRDNLKCISVRAFCDGNKDCSDGSDEPSYWNNKESYISDETLCRGHGHTPSFCVLPPELLPQQNRLCSDKNYCDGDLIACEDGSQCVSKHSICNGKEECRDGSDEAPLRDINQQYENEELFCRSANMDMPEAIYVLPEHLMPNKSSICKSNWRCAIGQGRDDSEVQCANGSQCAKNTMFCDGRVECNDGSDEIYSPSDAWFQGRMCRRAYEPTGFECMLPKSNICDGVPLCMEEVDECLCGENHFLDKNCFQCLTNPAIVLPSSKLCDGIVDCPDMTDECLCQLHIRPKICEKLIWNEKSSDTQEEPYYLECTSANDNTEIRISASRICDKKKDCSNNEDEMHCQREGITSPWKERVKDFHCETPKDKMAFSCDGIPQCTDFLDEECNCPNAPGYCKTLTRNTTCTTSNGTSSSPVDGDIMCDGRKSCDNFLDEQGCARFYCTEDPLPNIPIGKKCDLQDDCENGNDEKNCSHFYCKDGGNLKYISQDSVCDGIQDCQGGSDECELGCIDSAFSDEKDMITSVAVLAAVGILSITSIIGCSSVVIITAADLRSPKRPTPCNNYDHTMLSKILILNLSISDFLVGVYTVSICIKEAQFNGRYCLVDREWRSSTSCAALGSLLIIGSEESVFTMVLLTLQRLHAVMRPMSQPNFRRAILVIAMSWLVSISLAMVPIIPGIEDYFVNSIAFKENKLFKTISQNEKHYMIRWLNLIDRDRNEEYDLGTTEWSNLKNLVTKINPNITVTYEFGYYSSHSVCLPTFYPDPEKDQAWGYSLFILLINFTAFIFMLVSYIALYRRAIRTKALMTRSFRRYRAKQNMRMQRKLTRIVMSDFLCWMPVCIMGFLQLGGVNIPKDAYLPTGLFIIPINSALNPLLHSDLVDSMWNKFNPTQSTIKKSMRRMPSFASIRTSRENIHANSTEQLETPYRLRNITGLPSNSPPRSQSYKP